MKTKIIKIDPCKITGDSADGAYITENALNEAATLLREGRLVAFPTETVYGLGADAFNERAVQNIYEVKNRPRDNPLIIHIENIVQLESLAANIGDCARILAQRFWPGPLTMVFKKRAEIPFFMTAGLDTVAVRMPSHPVARALLIAAGIPVAAPSANPSGKPSPTNGAHVVHDLNGKIALIIDSGPVPIGLESTVLDATVTPVVILRPGGVTYRMIAEAIGRENVAPLRAYDGTDNSARSGGDGANTGGDDANADGNDTNADGDDTNADGDDTNAADKSTRTRGKRTRAESECERPEGERIRPEGDRLRSDGERLRHEGDRLRPEGERIRPEGDRLRSPGVGYRHYAPDAPMFLFKGGRARVAFWMKLFHGLEKNAETIAILASDELLELLGPDLPKTVKALSLGCADRPEIASRRFFDALRECDEAKTGRIYCELCNPDGIGAALVDRMTRASGGNIIDVDDPLILFVCTGNTCRSAMAEALFNAEATKASAAAGRPVNRAAPDGGSTAQDGGSTAQDGGSASPLIPRAVSAGLYADDGGTANFEAIEILKEYGADLSGHRSKPLDRRHMMRSNLVLTMTRAHAEEILERYPAAAGRVFTLADFIEKCFPENAPFPEGDISDPYGLGPDAYRECAASLYKMISPLAAKLTGPERFDTDGGVYYTENH